ncbi:MAG: DUF1501 domain-containing protein [Gemmataceae bacterium]|nr:DUF1501 domain-containing protein [Gemmataceae bacterium]MDW8266611.1 DUF1501 domain-containing protein [Gemmataceae bacterium]
MAAHCWMDCEGFNRRNFLKIGTAGLFGFGLSDLLRYEARAKAVGASGGNGKAKSVILVWLPGGPATIDMWDLKPNAPEGIRGQFKPIPTNVPGIEICEHLPRMAKIADKYTIVRSLHHTVPSHGVAATWMTTGNKPTPALQYPSLGSLAARLLPVPKGAPAYVTFGSGNSIGQAGYLGTAYNPFVVEGSSGGRGGLRVRGITLPTGFSLEELEDRDRLLQGFDAGFRALDKAADLADGLDAFHKQAIEILRSDRTKVAFDLSKEPASVRERYGNTPSGQAALAARRLVEAGVRFVTLSTGSWDTHQSNFETLKNRNLPPLDQLLSALIEDLDSKGLLESTIVYCAGEFGRTPKINSRGSQPGRDHWARSMAVVLAGGGFKRGYVHGSTDSQGMAPASEPCTPDDIAATIFSCLGIDPHSELMTSTGRPITLFREGRVIDKLLA